MDPERFTSELCLDAVREFHQALDTMREPLPLYCPIMMFARDVEWMGRVGEGAPDALTPAAAIDERRAARVFGGLLHFMNIVASLKACAEYIPLNHPVRWALRQSYDRATSLDEKSQDLLFELEVGGWLARRSLAPEFAEPDLVANFPGLGRIGLACKRPHSLKRLRKRVTSAAVQIAERTARDGVVVVDVQSLLYSTGDPIRKTYLDEHESQAGFQWHLENDIDDVARASSSITDRARERRSVLGVVFVATGWGHYRVRDQSASVWARVVRPSPANTLAEWIVARVLQGS